MQHADSSTRTDLVDVVQVAIDVHGGPSEDDSPWLDLVVYIL